MHSDVRVWRVKTFLGWIDCNTIIVHHNYDLYTFFAFVVGNLKITLLVFSGRPDPQWEILPTDPNHDRIKQLLDSARDQGFIYPIRKMQSRLGFKGFLIQNTAKKNKDPELIVGPDTVQLQQILLQSLPEGSFSEDFRKKISEEIKLTPSP